MSGVVGGLLLPQEVLTSSWFLLLATVVAFNTIIYLGLTISKFIPWPRQLGLRSMRGLSRLIGTHHLEEGDTPVSVKSQYSPVSAYDKLRGDVIRRDVPLALGLVGVALSLVAVLNMVLIRTHDSPAHYIGVVAGVLIILLAIVTGRRSFRPVIASWILSMSVVLVVGLVSVEAVSEQSVVPLGFALILMVAFPPIALSWMPAAVALAIQLVVFTVATLSLDRVQNDQFVVVGLAAAAAGIVMLRLRLQAFSALADQWQSTQRLATTDVLTGLLTRRGLRDLMPQFVATAARQGRPVWMTVVDIRNLNNLNNIYGDSYGDLVLGATARTLTAAFSRSFLVARWVGAHFVVVGLGECPDDVELAQRISDAIAQAPTGLGKVPAEIVVTSSQGDPLVDDFEALYERASTKLVESSPAGVP